MLPHTNATTTGFTPTMHPPLPMMCSRRDRRPFFSSPMVQPSDPPLFSSRFEGCVLVAMVGWLLEGWNQLRARTRCFWGYMRAYFRWLRCRCIRFWHGIPEPPERKPPHIDLTEEQLAAVLGKPQRANGKAQQQPPPSKRQEGLRRRTHTDPPGGLGRFPPEVQFTKLQRERWLIRIS